MTPTQKWWRRALSPVRRRVTSRERGDTLIEILIALTIIAIAVSGLVGGLGAEIASSGTHRNIGQLNNLIRSFAESVRQQVQLQPITGSPATGPSYQVCAGSYSLASAPYPSHGRVGTAVTIFAAGLTSAVTGVKLNGTAIPSPTVTASGTNANVTFTVPAGATSGPITIAGGNTLTSPVNFTVDPVGTGIVVNPSPLAQYSLSITQIQYWNGTTFVTSCNPTSGISSDLQQITVKGTAPGSYDQVNVVVSNPFVTKGFTGLPGGSMTVASSQTGPAFGSSITFTANLTGPVGWPAPTGTVSWSVTDPTFTSSTNCTSTTPITPVAGHPNQSTASCTLTNPPVGSYVAAPSYSGDSNYGQDTQVAPNPATITQATPNVNVSATPASPSLPSNNNLQFVAHLSGPGGNPSGGTVTWTGVTCTSQVAYNPSTGQATCNVNNASPGTYTATASYSGDANYAPNSGFATSVVPKVTPSTSLTYTSGGSTLTFKYTLTAPVAGDPPFVPGGNVTWPGVNCASTTALAPPAPATNPPSASATCTVNVPASTKTSFTPTATYSGDANYNSAQTTMTVYIAKVTVSGQPANGGNPLTFTATVAGPTGAPTPTPTITWSVSANGVPMTTTVCINHGTNPTNVTSLVGTAPSTATATCQIAGTVQTITYIASATYSGDSNYAPPNPNPTVSSGVAG